MSWQARNPQSGISPTDILIDDIVAEASFIRCDKLDEHGEVEIYNKDDVEIYIPTHHFLFDRLPEDICSALFPHGSKLHDYPCLSIGLRGDPEAGIDKALISEGKITQKALIRLLSELGIEGAVSIIIPSQDAEDNARLGGSMVIQVVAPPSQAKQLEELAAQLQYKHANYKDSPPPPPFN